MKGYFEMFYNKEDDDSEIVFYTDGSYNNIKNIGTYACISNEKRIFGKVNILKINSLICEMYAILVAITAAINDNHKSITIFTDNQSCMLIAGNNKCHSKYRDWFLEKLLKLEKFCDITIVNTSRRNNHIKQAHKLCKQAYQ